MKPLLSATDDIDIAFSVVVAALEDLKSNLGPFIYTVCYLADNEDNDMELETFFIEGMANETWFEELILVALAAVAVLFIPVETDLSILE